MATGGVTVGSISGGAFNPAVVFGSAIMGIYAWETIWVFLLANLLGALAAAIVVFTLNFRSSVEAVVAKESNTVVSNAVPSSESRKASEQDSSAKKTGFSSRNQGRLLRYKN